MTAHHSPTIGRGGASSKVVDFGALAFGRPVLVFGLDSCRLVLDRPHDLAAAGQRLRAGDGSSLPLETALLWRLVVAGFLMSNSANLASA